MIRNLSVFSCHMNIEGDSCFKQLLAVLTSVSVGGGQVFGLDVVFDICGFGLITTLDTLPPPPTQWCHHLLQSL